MEKSNTLPPRRRKKASRGLRKCCLLMILALMASLQAVCAQNVRVTLHLKDADFAEFITRVKQQTRYTFFYNDRVAKAIEPVTVDKDNVLLEEVLREVLSSKGFDFSIEDRTVIIRKAETSVQQQQETVVRGTVRDEKGQPLPGVTVLLKGTTMGVVSDNDGRYELNLPSVTTLTLVFSFVGMQTQEVKYAGQRELNIVMQEDVAQMDEVIVTGYSTRKVSEMTGAVQQFRGKEIAASATGGNLMNALKGHTTGLQITGSSGRPGQDGDLLLRGLGTLYGNDSPESSNSSPLIVIDGVITDYTSISGVVAASDIADITILKDAASTAIYGSRAATGVIVVTTKKGVKDRMSVSLDVKMGLNTPNLGGLRYMTSPELYAFGEMTMRNWWNTDEYIQADYANVEEFIQDQLGDLSSNFDVKQTTDWRDMAYRNGMSKDVALSIRGGGDKMQYYFSYNYYDEKGTQVGYDLTRHLFKTRMDFDVTDFLSFGVNMNATFQKDVSPYTGLVTMESIHPWLSPYNEDGTLKYNMPWWNENKLRTDPLVNPLLDNQYNDLTELQDRLFGSFSGTLKPFKWLTLSSTNTFTLTNTNGNTYIDSRTYSGNHVSNDMSNGILKVDDGRTWSFLTSNILRLQHDFGEHSLNGLIGQEWYERHGRTSHLEMYDQLIVGERNVGGFGKQGDKTNPGRIPTGTEWESGSFSVFSEVNYNYAGKYMASASFRTDASTNFGKDNRYGTFYSISASWLASREKFMQKQNIFSNLKFRLSYGTSGKEAGMDYLNYTLYSSDATFDYYREHPIYQSVYGAKINQLGNNRLSWETAHNLNFGVDMGFLKNRISLSVDGYKRRNSDLIMGVALPAANGVGQQYQNVGEMVNKGVELTLNTHTIKGINFNWYTTLTFSYNNNKLTKLDQGKLSRSGYPTFYEGDNFDELKKVKVVGVDPQTGQAQYERVEKDGTKTIVNMMYEATEGNGELSYVNIGLSRAPYWGGFTNTFNYKNWELYVHTAYSLNYKVYNEILNEYAYTKRWMQGNMHRLPSAWKIWEKPGDKADIPMISAEDYNRDLGGQTSFCYIDAAHFRISNIRLTYHFPQTWMDAIHLQSAALNFSCDNVYTFTSRRFLGADPENQGGWAAPRRFIFGLNVTF